MKYYYYIIKKKIFQQKNAQNGHKIFVEKSRIAGHVVCDISARKKCKRRKFPSTSTEDGDDLHQRQLCDRRQEQRGGTPELFYQYDETGTGNRCEIVLYYLTSVVFLKT